MCTKTINCLYPQTKNLNYVPSALLFPFRRQPSIPVFKVNLLCFYALLQSQTIVNTREWSFVVKRSNIQSFLIYQLADYKKVISVRFWRKDHFLKQSLVPTSEYLLSAKRCSCPLAVCIQQISHPPQYYLSELQYLMMLCKLLFLLALLLTGQSYDVNTICGGSGCAAGCAQCLLIEGGPFINSSLCIDPQICNTSYVYTSTSITCDGCASGICSYFYTILGKEYSAGCTVSTDQQWLSIKEELDVQFQLLNLTGAPYDWCGTACTGGSGLSAELLVAIIAGGVVVLAIVIIVAVKLCKRSKSESYQQM